MLRFYNLLEKNHDHEIEAIPVQIAKPTWVCRATFTRHNRRFGCRKMLRVHRQHFDGASRIHRTRYADAVYGSKENRITSNVLQCPYSDPIYHLDQARISQPQSSWRGGTLKQRMVLHLELVHSNRMLHSAHQTDARDLESECSPKNRER